MKVIVAPNPILRTKTKFVKKITDQHRNQVKEMIDLTKSYTDPEGVGLSANQVGISERFFIVKFGKEFTACFNPKITAFLGKPKTFMEGCLSIPDYYGDVVRPSQVAIEYQDISGNKISKKLKGVQALIFQHEYDHLEGILFMDRVLEQRGKVYKVVGKDDTGADIFEEITI